ncbi:MAG TPA: ABC-2 family transporter protein, partial [Dehalococcoidia bacterium]|nr:ABC-2 family transporter protein [Dehalococcoidia bacterium]
MKALAELYIQQFKTTLAMMFQYRASLFIWMIGQVLEPLVYLIVWSVVSQTSGGSVGGYTTVDLAAYFIVLMLVNQFTYTWIMYEFEYRVRQGTLSFALLKPVHPIHSDIADNVSSKLITLPIMILIAAGLAVIFHASISPAPWSVALFIPVLLLAFFIRFSLEWTLALAAFWTTRVGAINQTYFVLLLFLSGQIAPLALLPSPVQFVAGILPFRWMIGF